MRKSSVNGLAAPKIGSLGVLDHSYRLMADPLFGLVFATQSNTGLSLSMLKPGCRFKPIRLGVWNVVGN